ncbi:MULTISPECIES: hypothetical protein [unclassified Streptomyces]|uniref:hypothetical protein n=1 Tax=unclassified Streptomyces TaxID=2593676 RepID=UPI0004C11E63|nr:MULTISPECIES: hypothetical protein [unclassified Streptomyces]KOX05193.1 hypothetical protein ADL04_06830 [Streptomyces sp. NRRL B-3648]
MRMRRILGLALAAATLAGVSAVGAAASSPDISRDDCTAAGGQLVSRPYAGDTCVLPDGTTQAIT